MRGDGDDDFLAAAFSGKEVEAADDAAAEEASVEDCVDNEVLVVLNLDFFLVDAADGAIVLFIFVVLHSRRGERRRGCCRDR